MTRAKRYSVKTKKYKKSYWYTLGSFDSKKDADRFAIRYDLEHRNDDRAYDSIIIKDNETGEIFLIR